MGTSHEKRGEITCQIEFKTPYTRHTRQPIDCQSHENVLYKFGTGMEHRDYVDDSVPPCDVLMVNHPVSMLECKGVSTPTLRWLCELLQRVQTSAIYEEESTYYERRARRGTIEMIEHVLREREQETAEEHPSIC